MAKQKPINLRRDLNRATKIHFVFAGLLALQVIIFDAAQLITPDAVLKRWELIASLLVIASIVWFLAKERLAHLFGYKVLTLILVVTDIVLASIYVYDQRGMASRAVFLYLVAIVTVAILRSGSALFATAALCVAAYTTAAIKYFVDFFNEGYKVELYGEVGFYSAMFFVVAALIWTVIRSPQK